MSAHYCIFLRIAGLKVKCAEPCIRQRYCISNRMRVLKVSCSKISIAYSNVAFCVVCRVRELKNADSCYYMFMKQNYSPYGYVN